MRWVAWVGCARGCVARVTLGEELHVAFVPRFVPLRSVDALRHPRPCSLHPRDLSGGETMFRDGNLSAVP